MVRCASQDSCKLPTIGLDHIHHRCRSCKEKVHSVFCAADPVAAENGRFLCHPCHNRNNTGSTTTGGQGGAATSQRRGSRQQRRLPLANVTNRSNRSTNGNARKKKTRNGNRSVARNSNQQTNQSWRRQNQDSSQNASNNNSNNVFASINQNGANIDNTNDRENLIQTNESVCVWCQVLWYVLLLFPHNVFVVFSSCNRCRNWHSGTRDNQLFLLCVWFQLSFYCHCFLTMCLFVFSFRSRCRNWSLDRSDRLLVASAKQLLIRLD